MSKRITNTKARGEGVKCGFAPVNGLKLYYEIHGSGEPLVLLHGGVGGIEMFGPNLEAFAATRKVIAVNLQAHGHTADIDRPLRYELMGDDIAALIRFLDLEKVDLMGYSLGGGAALQTTFRHPEVVRKLVIVSTTFKRDGWHTESLQGFDQMGPETGSMLKQSPLAQLYPKVNWEALFGKLGELLRRDYDWTEDVVAIKSPVMLVFADADAIRTAHILEFFRLLGGGLRDAGLDGSGRPTSRLAILPGTTHYDILSTSLPATLVTPFLDAPMPAAEKVRKLEPEIVVKKPRVRTKT